ncbi:hypothetical protein CVV38_04045 [Candidatus Peregrinibacteria bacterium HGW-Peregrinibacteria-1]|nr:MAG: hypothetical protein CVV38_04045 [Candidatus Peregrinibacteria bacterium HGW-Peregrinibacteria-1]
MKVGAKGIVSTTQIQSLYSLLSAWAQQQISLGEKVHHSVLFIQTGKRWIKTKKQTKKLVREADTKTKTKN